MSLVYEDMTEILLMLKMFLAQILRLNICSVEFLSAR